MLKSRYLEACGIAETDLGDLLYLSKTPQPREEVMQIVTDWENEGNVGRSLTGAEHGARVLAKSLVLENLSEWTFMTETITNQLFKLTVPTPTISDAFNIRRMVHSIYESLYRDMTQQ